MPSWSRPPTPCSAISSTSAAAAGAPGPRSAAPSGSASRRRTSGSPSTSRGSSDSPSAPAASSRKRTRRPSASATASSGTEHLLLALFGAPEGLAAQVLAAAGITRANVETQTLTLIKPGERTRGRQAPFHPEGQGGRAQRRGRGIATGSQLRRDRASSPRPARGRGVGRGQGAERAGGDGGRRQSPHGRSPPRRTEAADRARGARPSRVSSRHPERTERSDWTGDPRRCRQCGRVPSDRLVARPSRSRPDLRRAAQGRRPIGSTSIRPWSWSWRGRRAAACSPASRWSDGPPCFSGSGDDALVEVSHTPRADRSRLVTADRGLRERAQALGAHLVGPTLLTDLLEP